jgi:hypothetical protein
LGILSIATQVAYAKPFDVAVLHGTFSNQYGKNLHNDEFDNSLKELGWQFTKYASTKEDLSKLTGELKKYDMALVCPLFNYGYADPYLPVKYAPALMRFVRDGGALVLTDAVYESHLAWLPIMDSGLTASLEGCNSQIDAFCTEPVSPFNNVPNILRINRTFNHYKLPKNTKWEIVARCGSHQAPAVLVRRIGKGFIYVTSFRHPNVQLLENMRANLELSRMGLQVEKFNMSALKVGAGEIEMTLKNFTNSPVDIHSKFTVIPKDSKNSPINIAKEIKIAAKKDTALSIPYDIPLRGTVNAQLTITSGENEAILLNRQITLPDLLTVNPPRYRAMALESDLQKNGQIIAGAKIAPYREKLETLRLKTRVTTAIGATVGQVDERAVKELEFKLPLKTGKLKAGEYTIHSELTGPDGVSEKKSAKFRVVKDSECPVFINDDANIIVDGKPFFPIGIYHVNPLDYKEVASLGLNTIQVWSWDGTQAVDYAKKCGLYSIWEQNHRKNTKVIHENVPLLKNKSGMLFWYSLDEPYEADFPVAKAVTAAYHKADVGHPTFMVSCRPELFADHAETADIMAVDPYPYPTRPLTLVSDWMDGAWKAVKGEQPVICVPQSFGIEPVPEFRVMTYLGLVHEARGIIWYPWQENDKEGMKYNPTLKKACQQLVGEIKKLAPALLNPKGRRPLLLADGKIHAMFCADPDGTKYLLLVNPEKKTHRVNLQDQPELKNAGIVKAAFGSQSWNPQSALTIKPLETQVYMWQ